MRKIVVTGCSQGLGRALVHEFIKAGHYVAGCSRSADAMQLLSTEYGEQHYFSSVDVSDETSVLRWADKLLAHIGVPDLVINNAAMINAPAPLWEVSKKEFQELIDINILGVHSVTRALLPSMIDAGSGVLVNLSSGWGRSVSSDVAPYCASKWAIEGMTKALAAELPAGLAAIPLNPGVIDTLMLRKAWGDGAGGFHNAEQWALSAAPYILQLNSTDNGSSLTVPN